MENKLKHYNFGLVDPKMVTAIWEYANYITPECPTIFTYIPNKTTIIACGVESMDKKIKIEDLPSDIGTTRMVTDGETSYILDPGILGHMIHIPDTEEYASFLKAVKAITYKSLRGSGIPLTESGNDIFFEKNGLKKKFFGGAEKQTITGWKVATFLITLDFNSGLANKIYRLDDEKFTKKGIVADMGNIVGGLNEVASINRDKLNADIIQKLAERYELTLEEIAIPEVELSKMTEYANRFNNSDWILYGRQS